MAASPAVATLRGSLRSQLRVTDESFASAIRISQHDQGSPVRFVSA